MAQAQVVDVDVDVEMLRCLDDAAHLDDVTFRSKQLSMTLNMSETGLVRSMIFLMQARSPDHQDTRTLFKISVGCQEPSGLILED